MGLFRKKCMSCGSKIDKGKEIEKDVKVIGLTGTHGKHFCCNGCLGSYEKGVEEKMNKSKSCCGCCGCCG